MTLPNWRNTAGTQVTNLMTSCDGTYQNGSLIRVDPDWGVTIFKRSLITGLVTETFDLSSVPALVSYGITPIVSDALGGDTHNGISNALDDMNRTWVMGNSRGTLPAHLIVSAPDVINSWTTFTQPFPGWAGTSIYGNYPRWLRLSDKRLILFFNRRDALAHDEGLEVNAFILPLGGGTTWQQLAPNGLFMDTDYGSVPERVYMTGGFVEEAPHKDRVWVAGVWRDAWSDGATQHDPFILYNDTVTNYTTWKRIDGTPQTIPITAANSIGTSAIVPSFGAPYWFPSGNLLVDLQGHPHMMNFPAAGNNQHVWWDGSSWQVELSGTGNRPTLHIFRNGQIRKYYVAGGRTTMTWIDGTNPIKIGGQVPVGALPWGEAFGDPIQLTKGNLHILVPDGNTPIVETLESNTSRATAS